ncbi:MAG TPA: YiiX/YebB-like N1pC/P60 family cysteine hydrolase [Isosphaeraceae bacterium]|nr:YiiX/YebB-like N1pC/P60 family cysteine hydrolase [Isosphaeraceae bacterium]
MGTILVWVAAFMANQPDGLEPTDRMAPPGWVGNPWGPAANEARESGSVPPVPFTPRMRQWDDWGRKNLQDGDIIFRLGDARVLFGYFPFSRFIARASGSHFSHTGVVAIEHGNPYIYDTSKFGVQRQPLSVWLLDNVGSIGVKRLQTKYQDRVPLVLGYCRRVYQAGVPFDYQLGLDDTALYCVEMTEKAFRAASLPLSEPVRLGDMENAHKFIGRILVFQYLSTFTLKRPLSLEQPVFFPGNERHGIWSSPLLKTIFPPSRFTPVAEVHDEKKEDEVTR